MPYPCLASGRHPVTPLVLLAAATGAWVVAAYFAAARNGDSRLALPIGHGTYHSPLGRGPLNAPYPRLSREARMEDGMGDIVLDALQKALKHLVAFVLVHHKGVSLAKGLKADALAHVLHGRKVLHPVGI